jgi:tetrahydromethanopterin S-methyltransferase subunit G
MGVIDEGRQLIQDFVAPEIRAIEARISAVEKQIESLEGRMDKRFDAIDKRFDAIDKRFEAIDKRFDAVDAKIDRGHSQILDAIHRMENYRELSERLAKIESKLKDVA